ncbi:Hypothetical_protein [Hexamita inflata]|uniref:Hypothetical_protein n=1 Tax=Hexamita inflata TaxID=28002 RepID=A0AA86NHN2_9EUKA|nr:Hypothetical protein HINF_LOCUS7040 [Hexamita inflata]
MSNLSYTTPEMRGINVKTINMMRIQQIMIKQQEQRILELEQQLQAPKIEQIQVVKKVSESDNMRKLIKQYGRTGRMFELILERLEHFDQTQRRKQFTDEELDLWLYIRTINLKWFIFDSQQFDGPDIRTIYIYVKNFAGRYHDQITTLYSFWSVINNQTGDDKCWKSIDEKVVQGMYVKQMFQQGAESRIQNKK